MVTEALLLMGIICLCSVCVWVGVRVRVCVCVMHMLSEKLEGPDGTFKSPYLGNKAQFPM